MSNETASLTDQQLIERFKDGETWAFGELVDRYASKAYQIAYGVLGNRQDAEEVAQDVFVRIHRALHKFRGDSEFSTWMYRIAMNLARNKYRWNKSRGAQRNISIDAPVEGREGSETTIDLPSERLKPDEQVSLDEFEENVRQELENLPPLYREALVLRNVKEMSCQT